MIRTIFAPPLDSQWRLRADWTPGADFVRRRDNEDSLAAFNCSTSIYEWPEYGPQSNRHPYTYTWWDEPGRRDRYNDWAEQRVREAGVMFPAGTVLIFDRYHISHSGDHAITLRLLISPDKRLTPKKRGGTLKGAGRIYFLVNELNTLGEVEQIEEKI